MKEYRNISNNEKVTYILSNLRGLLTFIRGNDMPMLQYLIEMAYMEANENLVGTGKDFRNKVKRPDY